MKQLRNKNEELTDNTAHPVAIKPRTLANKSAIVNAVNMTARMIKIMDPMAVAP